MQLIRVEVGRKGGHFDGRWDLTNSDQNRSRCFISSHAVYYPHIPDNSPGTASARGMKCSCKRDVVAAAVMCICLPVPQRKWIADVTGSSSNTSA